VGEQLKMTADNIYGVGSNSTYAGKLGTGRINMFRALTESPKSAKMDNLVTTDNNDDTFVFGDTLSITGDVINYLAPLTNLTVTLSSTSPYVTVLGNSITPGAMATMSSVNNNGNPFTVKVNNGAPLNSKVTLKINCTDGTYSTDQYFDVFVNVDYINVNINDVATSITSKGRLYYNDAPPTQGLGFIYNSANLIYDGGLMIGNNNNVSDMNRNTATYENDFVSQSVVQRVNPTVSSDMDLLGIFNDNNAPAATRLKVIVTHKAYAWVSAGNRKFVIVEYSIKNNGTSTLGSLYAGIFSDWDIPAFGNNKADVDNTLKMGYCYSTDVGGAWAGVKLLTQGGFKNYSIDNVTGGGGGIDITTDFTDAEKYTSLSVMRTQAGGAGTGNDVCQTVSTGPFSLTAGDSVKVAFAIIAGDNLVDLQTSATNAQIKYDGLTGIEHPGQSSTAPTLLDPFPNPAGNDVTVSFIASNNEKTTIALLDVVGKNIMSVEAKQNTTGIQTMHIPLKSIGKGIYFVRMTTGERVFTKKLVVE
jgi:serine protease